MILAIDSGNTMTKFVLMEDGRICHSFLCHNLPTRTSDEYYGWLKPHLDAVGVSFQQIEHCVICSVVPHVLSNLKVFGAKWIGGATSVLSGGHPQLGIEVKIENPQTVGSDLLANVMGAFFHYGKVPGVVVACGTATTATCYDGQGNFVGAIIAPGFKTSLDALCAGGAQLPLVDFERPAQKIGRNTMDAINAGMYYGYSGLVEKVALAAREHLAEVFQLREQDIPITATGGYLRHIHTTMIDACDEHLIFKGLWIFYERVISAPSHSITQTKGHALVSKK